MREHHHEVADNAVLLGERLERLTSQMFELESLRSRVLEAERKLTRDQPKKTPPLMQSTDQAKASVIRSTQTRYRNTRAVWPDGRRTLDIRDYREQFEKMSVDELWALHVQIGQILAGRLNARRSELETRLEQIRQTTGRGGSSKE